MATILVTDAEQRSGLAAVRSLGRAGHGVTVATAVARPLAGASRYVGSVHRVPSPTTDAPGYADAVARLAASRECDVVLPLTDASMLALLPRRTLMEPATIPFGSVEAFRSLSDKRKVTEAARELGLDVPQQEVLESPDSRLPDALRFPLVVKPVRSVVSVEGGLQSISVTQVDSPEELRRSLAGLPEPAFPVLLQQRIRGPGTGVFLLRWGGETRAVFAHRRLREKPPTGGVSVYRESVRADPDLVARSEALLDRFDWSGVAMAEFKHERETGTAHVMEVNARLWGSLQLAVDAGVDFPRLLIDAALGRKATAPPDYREGVRCRWLWGEVDHLIGRLRGEVPADSESDSPRRLDAVAALLPPWRPGDRFEVLRLSDPRPFLRETAAWVASLTARERRR